MSFLGIVVAFLMRACLSVTITEMVVPVNTTSNNSDSVICPANLLSVESNSETKFVSYIRHFEISFISKNNVVNSIIFIFDFLRKFLCQGGIRFNWTQEQQGWILSSFFIGYVITHIPGAILAQKFGGKWTLGLGILATAICSVLTPIVTEYGAHLF